MILKNLDQAERHVAQGERHIASQRKIVAELALDISDHAKASRKLLALFEDMQSLHIADRDRLRAELAAL